MEENNLNQEESKKRRRGRPPKKPGEPKMHYKKRNDSNPLASTHEYIQYLPDKSLSMCEEHLEKYFSTMFERALIWKRRFIDKLEAPWTDDKILQANKFPNVYRELDRSTQFLINGVIKPNKDTSLKNLVWKTIVYRLFNNPETFKLASFVWKGGIPNHDEFELEKQKYSDFMSLIQKLGANPFSNAYIISSSFAPNMLRAKAYVTVALQELYHKISYIMDTCLLAENPRDIITALKSIPGVKDFVAHELYNDLLYINKYTSFEIVPFSTNDYVNVGPGSLLGIRLIFPNLETRESQVQGMYRLLSKANDFIKKLEDDRLEKFPFVQYNEEKDSYEIAHQFNLTINNIEGWLCEYSKYWKMSIEVGKIQRKFEPISENDLYNNNVTKEKD